MNILYTCDDNYVWLMGISMISLFENNKDADEINVYLLGDNISDENKQFLILIANKYSRNCTVIKVPNIDIPKSLYSKRWPRSAFIRLYAGEILPNHLDKILYLDCDTIINQGINYLFSIDNDKYVFLGVKDCISNQYRRNIGVDLNIPYINAGVLLINLHQLRSINVSEEIDRYLNKYENLIHYADQDILNGIFINNIGVLPMEYNVMTLCKHYKYKDVIRLRKPSNFYTKSEFDIAINNPKIIHYTTCMLIIRPWYLNSNHLLKKEFRTYFDLSPWKNKEMNRFEFKTKQSKIMRLLNKLPNRINYFILGTMHSYLYPVYINLKFKAKEGIK